MRLHLLVVDGSSGETDALVQELRRAGFEPTLRSVPDASGAARFVAQAAEAANPSSPASPASPASPREAGGLAVDVLMIGPAGAGEGPIDPAVAEHLEAAHAALGRAADLHSLRDANRVAERALHESEERHRALVEHSAFGLWHVDERGATLYANPAMCVILEVDGTADLAARDPRSFFPGDGLTRMEAAQGERTCVEVEVMGAHGGRRRAICLESSIVSLGSKKERSVLRTFTDVTELRRLQEQSHQAQKLEAIGRLAGGIAHDFNNLLTVAYTCCGLLHRTIPLGDRSHAHVDQIQSAAKRGSALTRQLLAFARQHPVEPTSIDVNDVVTKMASMLRHVIGDDIELRVNTDRGLRPIRADRGQIEQVLMNLALNARDAMPRGGKLVVSTANVVLHVDEALPLDIPSGEYVLIAVTDTGLGMDEETRERIFEPFFTTKAGKGTGLGLATAFGIVRESGGAINVESTPGKGATFRLWMPAVKEAAVEVVRPTVHPPSARPATETVLLVDDEDGIRGSLAEFLRLQGFVVLEARNGLDAMDHARRHAGEIHVLVTDVVMPRMGGKSLADALLTLRPNMKVLFLSGYSESTILRRGHLDSGVSLLQKPFPPEALVSRIHELMAGVGLAK